MRSSYKAATQVKRAITVRVQIARLKKLMRARKIDTQSELINSLLSEEEERIEAEAILRATTGVARPRDIDARLL